MSIPHAVTGPVPLPMALAGPRTRGLAGTLALALTLPLTLRAGS